MRGGRYRRGPATGRAVRDALNGVRQLCERTPRERADERMRRAKDEFTRASVAVLKGEPGAKVQAERALQAIDAARRELAEIDGERV
jgi:hypothetical protein